MDLSTIITNRKNVVAQTTGQLDSKKEKYKEIDLLYESVKELCNDKFRLWYCKQFNVIGRERVLNLASEARADGKDPQKLFSHLITKETGSKVGAK
jgi:hypothetical protein